MLSCRYPDLDGFAHTLQRFVRHGVLSQQSAMDTLSICHPIVGHFKHSPLAYSWLNIMAYGSTPYVGMTPKKNGRHIKSAQITPSKCPR